jgi:hypothetical protein
VHHPSPLTPHPLTPHPSPLHMHPEDLREEFAEIFETHFEVHFARRQQHQLAFFVTPATVSGLGFRIGNTSSPFSLRLQRFRLGRERFRFGTRVHVGTTWLFALHLTVYQSVTVHHAVPRAQGVERRVQGRPERLRFRSS